MLTLLGTLSGFLGSFLPALVDIFKGRQNIDHEYRMAQLEIEREGRGYRYKLEALDAEALGEEAKVLHLRDGAVEGAGWVNALRGSVRPVLTYCFFLFYAAVKAAQYQLLIVPALPWAEPVNLSQALILLWGEEDMALFATIIGFWFGTRLIEKRAGRA